MSRVSVSPQSPFYITGIKPLPPDVFSAKNLKFNLSIDKQTVEPIVLSLCCFDENCNPFQIKRGINKISVFFLHKIVCVCANTKCHE